VVAQAVDHRPVGGPLPWPVEGVAERPAGQGAFARAAGADDQPDLPRLVLSRQFGLDAPLELFFQRHVEHAGHLLHAEGTVEGALVHNVNTRHE